MRRWRGRQWYRRLQLYAGWAALAVFVLWLLLGGLFLVRFSLGDFRVPEDLPGAGRMESASQWLRLAWPVFGVYVVGLATWLLFQLRQVARFRRMYRRDAKKRPEFLVQTTGPILGDVVGRDDLCHAIMEDLRDPRHRRPHLIVGGVGAGKTAMLVRLTRLLAGKAAIPVPVRLRDQSTTLDFTRVAQERFSEHAQRLRFSEADADKIWQRLRADNQIVVLADGLEEALQAIQPDERDNVVRLAITNAKESGLPLVVASRPHDPLRGMTASMTELEPLSERDALAYLRREGNGEDDSRLRWIVETAQIAESPLYLQIADELNRKDLLGRVARRKLPEVDLDRLDTRDVDMVGLRMRLLETWVWATVNGHMAEEVPLDRTGRRAVVEQLAALACVGLALDSLYVRFSDLLAEDQGVRGTTGLNKWRERQERDVVEWSKRRRRKETNQELFGAVVEELGRRLDPGWSQSLQLAATYGQRLGLVEPFADGVRFPHSLMQAYLGSWYVEEVMDNQTCSEAVLTAPSREFLVALVMRARRGAVDNRAGVSEAQATTHHIIERVRAAASERAYPQDAGPDGWHPRLDATVLDMYTAAIQMVPDAGRARLAGLIKEVTDLVHLTDPEHNTAIADAGLVEEGKLRLVGAVGTALQTLQIQGETEGARNAADLDGAYREFFRLGVADSSYAVRLAAAQVIGDGGDEAFRALRSLLSPSADGDEMLASMQSWSLQARQHPDGGDGNGHRQVAMPVPSHQVGAAAAVASPSPASSPTHEGKPRAGGHQREERATRDDHERSIRRVILSGWLVPLFAGSVSEDHRDEASEMLEEWVDHVITNRDSEAADKVNARIALAQGFKTASNRRRRNPAAQSEARDFLSEQAYKMLHGVPFWYCRLSLLHALTLWSLPDGTGNHHQADASPSLQSPDALVRQWRTMTFEESQETPDGAAWEHPFVAEAARLCVLALESGQPERFCWIDESGVLSKTGAGPVTTADPPRRDVWIPSSTGWSSLDPRGQQLAVDVLLMLNLAEDGRGPKERAVRLKRTDRPTLPTCLTRDRRPLDPGRTVGVAHRPNLRSECVSDCMFGLCPYPLKGEQAAQKELSEALCRRQKVLLRARLGHARSLRWRLTAPWQGQTKRKLREFWDQMAERSRR